MVFGKRCYVQSCADLCARVCANQRHTECAINADSGNDGYGGGGSLEMPDGGSMVVLWMVVVVTAEWLWLWWNVYDYHHQGEPNLSESSNPNQKPDDNITLVHTRVHGTQARIHFCTSPPPHIMHIPSSQSTTPRTHVPVHRSPRTHPP